MTGFTIPDQGEGADDIQSILYQEDIEVLVAGINCLDCVLSGCAVTAQGSPDMTVAVAKGAVLSNGALFPVTAGNVTITAADATNPRIDLVVVNASGTKAARAGTPAAAPKPPVRTANDVVIAQVLVPANDTTIGATQIIDRRLLQTQGPIVLKKTTTAVTFNTDNTAKTYFTITLPDGLFLTGKALRVRCGGNYRSNVVGGATWTLTIAYGGTTMFADATATTANDADRGAWDLDFILNASGDATQTLTGRVAFQTPGAKAAPTTGTAGDLAVVTHVVSPFRGAASVDSNAADRTLTVQWTMSVSDGAMETVMDFGSAELL